jgi:hypothetical protein
LRLVLVILLTLNSVLAFSQAEFSVSKKTINHGKVKEGVLLSFDYEITNTGTEPLIFTEYKVACSCTKATLPDKPLAPGEKIKINVTFDTKGKIGFQDRTIEVTSNAKNGLMKLRFKVTVQND